MRPLLAPPARSDGGRRVVRPVYRGGVVMGKVPKVGLIAAVAFFVLDQVIKWLVVGPLGLSLEGDERAVLPIFTLRNLHNPGVSLGFLKVAPEQSWMLVVLTGAIACAVFVWMWREAN